MRRRLTACVLVVPLGLVLLVGCGSGPVRPPAQTASRVERAVDVLRACLRSEKVWPKVHAAEALLAAGYPDGIRAIYERELSLHEAEPKYRIGIWRVLARTAPDEHDRQQWIRKIVAAFLDTGAPDRATSSETLSKLEYAVTPEERQAAARASAASDPVLASMATWLLDVAGNPSARRSLCDALSSPEPDRRRLAAYALRFRPHSDAAAARLLEAAMVEPPHSPARVYLLSAALVQGVPSQYERQFRESLHDYAHGGSEPDKYEAANGLGLAGGREDLAVLESMLDDPQADARIGGALAILRIEQRSSATKPEASQAGFHRQ